MKIPTKSLCKFQHNLSLKKISSRHQIQQNQPKNLQKIVLPSPVIKNEYAAPPTNPKQRCNLAHWLQSAQVLRGQTGPNSSRHPGRFDGWIFLKNLPFLCEKRWFLWTSCRYFVIVMDIL